MAARALNVARREYVLILLAVGFVLFRVIGFIEAEPRTFPDTGTFEHTAREPILSNDFFEGWKAPTLPLLYKLVTGDEARIWAQLAISIVCWLALAAAVAATISGRRFRPLAFAVVLLFALASEIVLWDADLLSESVSLSLLAAVTATWLWIVRRPSPWAYGAMLALTAAWAFARDPHPYVTMLLALLVAGSIAVSRDWGGPRYLRAAAAVSLVAIAVAGYTSGTAGFARWALPVQHVISTRISTHPDQLAYFEDAGMPVTPELLAEFRAEREGMDVLGSPTSAEPPNSAAAPFHGWLRSQGHSTYTRFLVTHPGVVAGAFGHLGETLLDPEVASYASHASPWHGGPASAAIYPQRTVITIALLTLSVGLAAFVALRFGGRREWLVPVVLIAVSLPFAILVYNADTREMGRHSLDASVFLRLGMLLLILFAVDRWLQARRGEIREAPAGIEPA